MTTPRYLLGFKFALTSVLAPAGVNIPLPSGTLAAWPDLATLLASGEYHIPLVVSPSATRTSREVVYITAVGVTDTAGITVTRGEEGTTARQWPVNARIENNLTAETLNALIAAVLDGTTTPIPTAPGKPALPVLTAMAGAVSLAWTAGAAGSSATTSNVWLDINGDTTVLTTNPQIISAAAGTPYTGTVATINAQGAGPSSDQAVAVTPTAIDTGFDIILMAGQSNMAGRAVIGSYVDTPNASVQQWGAYATNTTTYKQIVQAADPLSFPDATTAAGTSGPALWFARSYLSTLASGRRVLIVPVAIGGQAMVATTAPWHPGNPGGTTFEMAVARSNEAIAAAIALYPTSKFVGIAWLQGESDGDASVTQAAYDAGLRLVISTLRARITGAANSWFVLGGMVPEALTAHPLYLPIKAAQKAVVASTQRTAYIEGLSGYSADNLHYTVLAGAQLVGPQIAGIIPTAIANVQQAGVAPVNSTLPSVTGSTVQGGTLTSTTGGWSNYPDVFTYQWLRNAVAIAGATASTYPTVLADVGSAISCAVIASSGGTVSTVATSLATTAITSSVSTTTTTYTFEADTVGATPANTTVLNGTYEVVATAGADTTKSMHMSVSQTSPNPGAISLDLLTTPNADQTLTWRSAQTSATSRNGFLLRPQVAFTTLASNVTVRCGYLFQVSASQNALKLFSVTSDAVTQIGTTFTLTTSAATHFRASCIGSTIKFEYSTDSMATWITAITVTNTDTTAASTAAVQWINNAVSLTAYVDDISLTA